MDKETFDWLFEDFDLTSLKIFQVSLKGKSHEFNDKEFLNMMTGFLDEKVMAMERSIQ